MQIVNQSSIYIYKKVAPGEICFNEIQLKRLHQFFLFRLTNTWILWTTKVMKTHVYCWFFFNLNWGKCIIWQAGFGNIGRLSLSENESKNCLAGSYLCDRSDTLLVAEEYFLSQVVLNRWGKTFFWEAARCVPCLWQCCEIRK